MPTPRQITEDVLREINDYLLTGCTIETACACCDIQPATYRSWIRRGRAEFERLEKPRTKAKESEAIFLDFYLITTRTLNQVKARLIGEIAETASGYDVTKVVEVHERVKRPDGTEEVILKERRMTRERERDWRAGAWLLERRHPDEFSGKQKVEHSAGEGVISIQINAPALGNVSDPGADDNEE